VFLLPIQEQIIFLFSVKIIAVGFSGLVSERFARLRPLHRRRVDMNSVHSRELLFLNPKYFEKVDTRFRASDNVHR
jgi:hypothetical protein